MGGRQAAKPAAGDGGDEAAREAETMKEHDSGAQPRISWRFMMGDSDERPQVSAPRDPVTDYLEFVDDVHRTVDGIPDEQVHDRVRRAEHAASTTDAEPGQAHGGHDVVADIDAAVTGWEAALAAAKRSGGRHDTGPEHDPEAATFVDAFTAQMRALTEANLPSATHLAAMRAVMTSDAWRRLEELGSGGSTGDGGGCLCLCPAVHGDHDGVCTGEADATVTRESSERGRMINIPVCQPCRAAQVAT
ncbi:hypothetical protein ACQEVF_57490 [Nonomuraea polychroma]|uniref:hypothetical protein n=1 Tax=Nonomuraea polychroma TaxID=46176 RepID=UPI003D89BDED